MSIPGNGSLRTGCTLNPRPLRSASSLCHFVALSHCGFVALSLCRLGNSQERLQLAPQPTRTRNTALGNFSSEREVSLSGLLVDGRSATTPSPRQRQSPSATIRMPGRMVASVQAARQEIRHGAFEERGLATPWKGSNPSRSCNGKSSN